MHAPRGERLWLLRLGTTQEPGVRGEQGRTLLKRTHGVYAASEGTYGSPGICAVLRQVGTRVSRKRVARVMREAGLRACAEGQYRHAGKLPLCPTG